MAPDQTTPDAQPTTVLPAGHMAAVPLVPVAQTPVQTAPTQLSPLAGQSAEAGDDEAEALFALKSLEERRRKRRRQRWLRIGAVLALACLGIGAFVLRGLTSTPEDDIYVPATAMVMREDFKTTVQGSGALQPASTAVITPEVDGTIESLLVTEGQTVKAGDTVLTIKNPDLDKAIDDAAREVSAASRTVGEAQQAYGDLQSAYAKDKAAHDAAAAQAEAAQAKAAAAGEAAYAQVIAVPQAEFDAALADELAAKDALTRAEDELRHAQEAAEADPDNVELALAVTTATNNRKAAELEHELKQNKLDNAKTRLDNAKDRAQVAYDQAYAQVPIPMVPDFSEASYTAQLDAAQSSITSAQNVLTTAQAAYDAAVEQAGKRTVKTPKGGTVISVGAKVGASTAGTATSGALVEIADISKMRVTVQVNELDISSIKVGQHATVTFSALPDLELDAEVASIASTSGGAGDGGYGGGVVSFPVELVISKPDARLKPGMTASVTIATQDVPDALVVPLSAVTEEGATGYVFVVTNEETMQAEMRTITLGERSTTEAVVTSGLSEGELVLLSPEDAYLYAGEGDLGAVGDEDGSTPEGEDAAEGTASAAEPAAEETSEA